ncbi:unnamed protein product [Rotaria magnacalcarata]|uniref:Uncharacterized protein n=1 Tax=Rotaria magnacalcarata TaxID=392030 RepID=A0A816BFI2_9BILA|nr:unnamed protein product [Rotaria magnacalcarata]
MRATVFLLFASIVIVICLCLMPMSSEALPAKRSIHTRCPPTCSIYCPCGNILDRNSCPICRCRPSNVCTGRHPNAHPRQHQSYGKSRILY